MNLPVGAAKETGLQLSQEGLSQTALALSREGFTGYLVLTIEGVKGVEEAVLFFKGFEIIGTIYEFSRYNKTIYGDEAFKLSLNAGAAEHGVMDVYSLTKQQLDLVLAFNNKILLRAPVGIRTLHSHKVKAFKSELSEKYLTGLIQKKHSKLEVLKRFGLGRLK
jgi:hypothetical protein